MDDYQHKMVMITEKIEKTLTIITIVTVAVGFLYVMETCNKGIKPAQARVPNFSRDAVATPMPPPLTEEEYLELSRQERYGACYPYCKEANQLWVDHIWRLIDKVQTLERFMKKQRFEIEQCQQNVSLPPMKCEPCVDVDLHLIPPLPPPPP